VDVGAGTPPDGPVVVETGRVVVVDVGMDTTLVLDEVAAGPGPGPAVVEVGVETGWAPPPQPATKTATAAATTTATTA